MFINFLSLLGFVLNNKLDEFREFVFKDFHSEITGERVYNCKLSDIIKYDKNKNKRMFVNDTVDDSYLYLMKIQNQVSLDDNFVGKILDEKYFSWDNYMSFLLYINLKCSDGICFIDFLGFTLRETESGSKDQIRLVINQDNKSPKEFTIKKNDKDIKTINNHVVLIITKKSILDSDNFVRFPFKGILCIGTTFPINLHTEEPNEPATPEPTSHRI